MIFDLYIQCFGRELNKDIWEWRFSKYVFGKPIIKLAFSDDMLVTLYLLRPVKFVFQEKCINALFSMNTMTHPDFAGRGIMTNLATDVYNEAHKNNYSAIIGFANSNSRYLFTNKLGFKEVAATSEICFNLNEVQTLNDKYKFIQIEKFDEAHSFFYKSIYKTIPKFIVPRTHDYLNWRFIENPESKYYCYNIMNDDKIVGYCVLKNYNGKKCHIIDFLIENDSEIFESLINHAIHFCKKNLIEKLTLWCNKTLPFYDFLLQKKFYTEPMQTYFVLKALSTQIESKNMGDFDNWYLTMSDSDVF